MKIIQPTGENKKSDDSSAIGDKNNAQASLASTSSSNTASKVLLRQRNFKSKHQNSVEKYSGGQNQRIEPSDINAKSEQLFDFDTSNLEAMPQAHTLEDYPEGKKRRRSELSAEKVGESNSRFNDPARTEFNELFARGLRLLAMREHSVKEIRDKLADKADNFDLINAVIDELRENKYQSDERFTETYVRARSNRGFGPIKIKAELKAKGISASLIQEYLDQGAALWFDSAKNQYLKKFGDTTIQDYSAWTKRARFLQGRGFNMEQIHCVVAPVESD